ncbi:MAG: hypothetical protein IPI67_00860 [Myxococcales bacterium]|nr:hypothetical protein [Myxococcales bacterium]
MTRMRRVPRWVWALGLMLSSAAGCDLNPQPEVPSGNETGGFGGSAAAGGGVGGASVGGAAGSSFGGMAGSSGSGGGTGILDGGVPGPDADADDDAGDAGPDADGDASDGEAGSDSDVGDAVADPDAAD